jgi:KAP family P-loop domain
MFQHDQPTVSGVDRPETNRPTGTQACPFTSPAPPITSRRPRPDAAACPASNSPKPYPATRFPTNYLAGAIRGGTPAQFTIGIYGAWGSGKSSLLNAVARRLSEEKDVIPVLFDPWRYETTPHIVSTSDKTDDRPRPQQEPLAPRTVSLRWQLQAALTIRERVFQPSMEAEAPAHATRWRLVRPGCDPKPVPRQAASARLGQYAPGNVSFRCIDSIHQADRSPHDLPPEMEV